MFLKKFFLILLLSSAHLSGILYSQSIYAGHEVFQDKQIFETYKKTVSRFSQNSKKSLTESEIEIVFKKTIENPVANLDVIEKYDPTGAIGFCFGRALTAQLSAMELGLDESVIKKLFVIGDLRSSPEKGEWRFHVTTLVPRDDGKYIAIDPITYGSTQEYRPFEAHEWVEFVRKGWDQWHGKNPKALFYLSDAETILPDITHLTVPEDGQKLIELNFNPLNKGFVENPNIKQVLGLPNDVRIFRASTPEIERSFFLTTQEPEETRFNFEGLSVSEYRAQGEGSKTQQYNFSYNGYFKDLLKTFNKGN